MKIVILLLLSFSLSLSVSAESIGRIIKLHGTVYKFNANKAEKKLVKNGDYIYREDSLETERGSIVKVIMNDETVFQLGPKSQFAFEKFKMRTKNDRDATYSLKYGQLRSLFTRKAPKRSLVIKARNVSMGIRGTEILTNVFKNKQNKFQTDIALLTGKLEIMQKVNNQIKKVFIKPGFKFSTQLIAQNNMRKAIKKLPPRLFNQIKRKKSTDLQAFLPLAKTANNSFNKKLIQREQMADKVFVKPVHQVKAEKLPPAVKKASIAKKQTPTKTNRVKSVVQKKKAVAKPDRAVKQPMAPTAPLAKPLNQKKVKEVIKQPAKVQHDVKSLRNKVENHGRKQLPNKPEVKLKHANKQDIIPNRRSRKHGIIRIGGRHSHHVKKVITHKSKTVIPKMKEQVKKIATSISHKVKNTTSKMKEKVLTRKTKTKAKIKKTKTKVKTKVRNFKSKVKSRWSKFRHR